jgi:hypothetical protein
MKKIFLVTAWLLAAAYSFAQDPGCSLDRLIGDVKADRKFSDKIVEKPELVDSWKRLDDWERPNLKKDIPTLESLQKITDSDKLKTAFDDDFLKSVSDAQKGAGTSSVPSMKELFDNIANAFKDLDLSKVKNMDLIKSELKRTDFGKMIGANWTLEYIGKNTALFQRFDEIIFESVEKIDEATGTLIRRVDVKCISKGADGKSIATLFEFKSVQPPLPPSGFADQFIKDLRLTDVTSMDQLKWIFDGKKVSSLTKSDFITKLDEANIPDDVIKKLVTSVKNPVKDDLLDLIESNFDNIFQIR